MHPLRPVPFDAVAGEGCRRCVALGVGTRLLPGEVDLRSIADAVDALLGQPRFRRRASEVATEIRAMAAPADLAATLAAVAVRR